MKETKMNIKWEFNWHDKWLGVYDEIKEVKTYNGVASPKTLFYHIWICIVPCFPIHIWWQISQESERDPATEDKEVLER